VNDLAPGKYFAAAAVNGYGSFVPQVWQNIDCPAGCAATTGTGIVLPAATTAQGIDFALLRRDAIVGRVTDNFGAPLPGVLLDLFDAATGTYVNSGISDGGGYYAAGAATGQVYFLATDAGGAFIDQVYSGIKCPAGTAYFGLCALTNATPVAVIFAAIEPHRVDFQLEANDVVFLNGFE
jgi:hypothetical protein